MQPWYGPESHITFSLLPSCSKNGVHFVLKNGRGSPCQSSPCFEISLALGRTIRSGSLY